MRTRLCTAVAGAVLATALLAACADEPGAPEPTRNPTGSPPTTEPTVPPPQPPEPSVPGTPSPPLTGDATLTGQVVAGVEAGCKLLETDHGAYLLTGEAAQELAVGATVTVRGEVRPDLMSICQQGTPFEVTEVLD